MMTNIEWKKFKISDVFHVKQSKHNYHANQITIYDKQVEGTSPYVVRSALNNGIRGYIKEQQSHLNSGNTISFAQDTFVCFYQDEPYFTGNKIKVLAPKDEMNRLAGLYITSALNKALSAFSWGVGSDQSKIEAMEITLPATADGSPDYKFMADHVRKIQADHVRKIQADHVRKIQAYLEVTGLNDTVLTQNESDALNSTHAHTHTHTPAWSEYRLKDLFSIAPTKSYKDLVVAKQGLHPVVSNTSSANGIIGYTLSKANNPKNIITFSDTTNSDETFFYQEEEFVGYAHVQAMQPLFNGFNKMIAMFIITQIAKAIKGKYNYGTKFNRATANETIIKLPTAPDGKPDFVFMENYIRATQKQVIKNLVSWNAKELDAYKEVIA